MVAVQQFVVVVMVLVSDFIKIKLQGLVLLQIDNGKVQQTGFGFVCGIKQNGFDIGIKNVVGGD
jgi:hypothetical protein